MSQIELLLLGMLMEKPQSAYDLQKDIEKHKLSRWTKISVPSVYKKVLQLREKGCLKGNTVRGSRLADKVVYEITEEGRGYFEELMRAYAHSGVTFCLDLNVVVANLNKLEPSKAMEILSALRQTVQESARQHDGYLEEYRGMGLPLAAQTVLDQQKQLYDALLAWLETFAGQFEQEAGKDAEGKPYGTV